MIRKLDVRTSGSGRSGWFRCAFLVDCSRPWRVEPRVKGERLGWYRQPVRFLVRARAFILEVNVHRTVGVGFQVASIPECVAVSRIRDGEPLQIVDRD